jgi:DNA polymerase-1
VDADVLVYQASAGAQDKFSWDGEEVEATGNIEKAKLSFKKTLNELITTLNSPRFTLCFSSSPNFRKTVLPTYKLSRKTVAKPVDYLELEAWAKETYHMAALDTLEADDVLGILHTQRPDDTIMVSIDGDMLTIPGRFYKIGVQGKPGVLYKSTVEDAHRFFLTQTVIGDTGDGYTGVPGVGPAKAEAAFKEHGYTWETVVMLYESKGLTEEDAIQQARCARILTKDLHKNGQVVLWTPNHI